MSENVQRFERDLLIARRRAEYADANPGWPNFGRATCSQCKGDVVSYYGESYPTACMTGCPYCHESWCD